MWRALLLLAILGCPAPSYAQTPSPARQQGTLTAGHVVIGGSGNFIVDGGSAPLLAGDNPDNLLLNTEWKVLSAEAFSGQINQAGTAVETGLSFTSFTTATNAATFAMASTGELKVNDLVAFSGTADPVLAAQTGLITAVVANTSATAVFPLGLTPGSTTTGTMTQKQRGDLIGVTGAGPDQWTKSSTLLLSRDNFTANSVFNSYHQLWIQKGSASTESFYQTVSSVQAPLALTNLYRGKTVTFGIGIRNPGACTWRPWVNDGSLHYGTAITATAATWQELSFTFGSSISTIAFGVDLTGASGCTFYVGNTMAMFGSAIGGPQNFQPMPNETVPGLASIVPPVYNGNTSTVTYPSSLGPDGNSYGFAFRPYLDTNGMITWDVKSLNMQIEGRCTKTGSTTTNAGTLALRSSSTAPTIFSLLDVCMIIGPILSQPGTLRLGSDGNAWLYSPIQSDVWTAVAFDINSVGTNHE